MPPPTPSHQHNRCKYSHLPTPFFWVSLSHDIVWQGYMKSLVSIVSGDNVISVSKEEDQVVTKGFAVEIKDR